MDECTLNQLLYRLFSDCDNDTFNCASGIECTPMSSVCDGQLDCPDMSDEFGCGRLKHDITYYAYSLYPSHQTFSVTTSP